MLIYYYYLYINNIQGIQEMRSVPHWEHGKVKRNKKVLYHFAIFAIINELINY